MARLRPRRQSQPTSRPTTCEYCSASGSSARSWVGGERVGRPALFYGGLPMADTPSGNFLERLERGHNENQTVDRIPTELTGDLAAGTVIAVSSSADEKVRCKGAYRMRVVVEVTGTTPDGDLDVVPYLGDGTIATYAASNVAIAAAATQYKVDIDLYGAAYVNIKVTNNSGSNTITITRVDVSML